MKVVKHKIGGNDFSEEIHRISNSNSYLRVSVNTNNVVMYFLYKALFL